MNRSFSEKEFFLEIFHGKILCFSLLSYDAKQAIPSFADCLWELADSDIRSVLFVYGDDCQLDQLKTGLGSLHEHTIHWNQLRPHAPLDLPTDLWKKKSGIFPIVIDTEDPSTFLDRIVTIATSWRISRMMFIEDHGGLKDKEGNLVNFVNFQRLSESATHLNYQSHQLLEKLLSTTQTLLSHGIGAVGLCRMEDINRELFTYEGYGTFFSCKHYCEVNHLVWDDFPKVATLIHQGVKEGYLLPRSEEQLSKILLNGFGAFISGNHLAGACSLFTEGYEKDNAGEVVALYALTRFQGEGIGARLVDRLKDEGRKKGLDFLFACTQQVKVMDFFLRQNFLAVDASRIPAAKWQSYDKNRKDSVRCFVYHLKGF